MSATTPPTKPVPEPLSTTPPPERFWEKYSPHYEFPISTVATGVLHVLAVAAVIIIATRLMRPDEKTPVPIRSVTVTDGALGGLAGDQGSGGGEAKAEVTDERPQDPIRHLPEVELKREMIAASTWIPELKDNPEALKMLVESPNFKKLDALNDDLKKRAAEGMTSKRGSGDGMGTSTSNEPGKGAGGTGGPGDATSSGNRSNRWIITFKTNSGPDYLKQLGAFSAKLVLPEPTDWKRNRLFDTTMLDGGKLLGENDALPSMRFIDDDRASARRMARALGLDYDPPYFVAFFPKAVEDELAAKERSYRNRKEDQIKATTFSVLERDGKYEIKVTDQIAGGK